MNFTATDSGGNSGPATVPYLGCMVIDNSSATEPYLGVVSLQYGSPVLAAPNAAVGPFLGKVRIRNSGIGLKVPNSSYPLLGEVTVVSAGPNGVNGPDLGEIDSA